MEEEEEEEVVEAINNMFRCIFSTVRLTRTPLRRRHRPSTTTNREEEAEQEEEGERTPSLP